MFIAQVGQIGQHQTIWNLRVHLNITKVKVVHHVSHQNFFKKSNIGIVLPLKERMAPSLIVFISCSCKHQFREERAPICSSNVFLYLSLPLPKPRKPAQKVTDMDLNWLVDY